MAFQTLRFARTPLAVLCAVLAMDYIYMRSMDAGPRLTALFGGACVYCVILPETIRALTGVVPLYVPV